MVIKKGQHISPKTEFKKGQKFSEEIIKKMSEAAKRNKNGFQKGYIPWNKGKKNYFSKEALKGISEARKGKKRPPFSKEIRKNMSEAQKGKKGHNWQGGITPKNRKIRQSIEFKLWREAVFERDKFLCQMPDCDKSERYLNAHHIKLFSLFPDLRFDINNGITLCRKCHTKTKTKEEKFEELFYEILKLK